MQILLNMGRWPYVFRVPIWISFSNVFWLSLLGIRCQIRNRLNSSRMTVINTIIGISRMRASLWSQTCTKVKWIFGMQLLASIEHLTRIILSEIIANFIVVDYWSLSSRKRFWKIKKKISTEIFNFIQMIAHKPEAWVKMKLGFLFKTFKIHFVYFFPPHVSNR